VQITPDNGVPIYLQVVNQVKHHVASGRLVPGDELPPIRVMAEQLKINPNTVARAYRELEMTGLVEKRGTIGTYISAAASPLARRERLRILTERVDALVIEADHLNIDVDEIVEIVRKRGQSLRERKRGNKP
jgi:GntR family transcriptional regulator